MLRVKIKQEVLPLIKNLWQAAKIGWRIDRRNLVLYGVTMIMQVASSISATYFAAQVLNELFRVLSANASTSALYRNFLLSAVLLIVEQVAWRLMSYYQNSSFIVWHTQLAPEFHGKLASLDIGRFEDGKYSKLINKVSQDYAWRPSNFMYHGLNTIHGVMRLIGTAVALFAFSPLIVLILLVVVLPSLIVESRQSKVKWNIWNVKGDASRRYHKTTWMMQNKQDIMDMKVFGLVDYLIDFTRRMLDDFNKDQQKALKRFIRPAVIARIIEGSIVGGINFWLIHRVISGVYDVGQYSFYSGMVNQFNNAIGIVLSSTGTLYEYNLYMTDYFTFMQTPPLLHKTDSPKKVGGSVPEIVFENVSFS